MLSVTATIASQPSYGGTTSYAYDPKNELTTEQSTTADGYAGSYGYDGAGNPTTFKGQTSTFNSANQNTANVYDKAGNPTTYSGQTLTFDVENRMTAYGSVLTNGYRGDSQRAWKQNAGGRTYFLYSGSQLVCELSSSGAVTTTNTVGPAGLISRRTSSGSVFYAFDTHGSVVQRLGSNGNVLSTQTFDAYGSRLSTDSNLDPYAGYGGQSGYYTDWETGTATSALELLTFRYYDPSVGRFLTRDPIGYKGGANSYEYVNNNPTGGSDPLGLLGIGPISGGCIGAILGNFFTANSSDCGNDNYAKCLEYEDCLADAAAAALGVAIVAFMDGFTDGALSPLSRFIYGCAEGLASAILHNRAENTCRAQFHPCTPDSSPLCKFLSNLADVALGCLDGALGNYLDKNEQEEMDNAVFEFLYESITATASNSYESSNCWGAG